MKILKKILKILLVIFLAVIILLTVFDIYLIKKPEIEAKKKIEGIEEVSSKVEDLSIPESVKIIGLGEASHGNAEFQELKLDVLKVLVDNFKVNTFALEMDYGEGVIINDYINVKNNMSIDEVMNKLNFTIYKTEEMRNLIEWMKEYNLTNSNKLSFYGFDLQNPDVDLNLIIDFMKENSILESLELAGDANSYLSGEVSFKDESLEPMFDKLDALKQELINNKDKYVGVYNYQRIIDCIDNVKRAKELAVKYSEDQTLVKGGEYRDQMMAKRVEEIASTLDESRIMIAGHNGHIGYAGSYTKTMGSFIRDDLSDKYFAIGTDYFITNANIANASGKRANHRFVSGDILAYQAKELGTYYLDFSKTDDNSIVNDYVTKPIYMGSLGESYSILNTVLQDTVRIYCEPNYLYDAMIYVYEVTPLNLLNK